MKLVERSAASGQGPLKNLSNSGTDLKEQICDHDPGDDSHGTEGRTQHDSNLGKRVAEYDQPRMLRGGLVDTWPSFSG